jgi:hypothetical protein
MVTAWRVFRTDLRHDFDDIPDALLDTGEGWTPFEYVRVNPVSEAKLRHYDKQFKRSYIVMPTTKRIELLLSALEDSLPSSKLWFTSEDMYRKDILGKIWWTPKNFRDRQYSILPES